MSISNVMTHDHRACDALFAAAERAAGDGDWPVAKERLARFSEALLAHFDAEEGDIFPRFEEATGMTQGPTRMMMMEHVDMRRMLDSLAAAAEDEDEDAFCGEAETLLIMMQQHNMKEENILYPMCDAQLPGGEGNLAARLKGHEAR